MRTHQEIEQRSLALHRAVVEKIDADPRHAGLQKARTVHARWISGEHPVGVDAWNEILKRPWRSVRSILLEDSERGRELRQSSPFCGILTPKERWAIWKRFSAPLT